MRKGIDIPNFPEYFIYFILFHQLDNFIKFYMHLRRFGENLIKGGVILSAQWRFSVERYQRCPVTLSQLFVSFSLVCPLVPSFYPRLIP